MIDGTYFTENTNNVLGTVETRKNKYGRMEEFVSGNKEEAIKRIEEIGKEYITKNKDSTNKVDLGEVRDEDMESDFFEFKKSDEVSFQRFRENKARERMLKNKEKKPETKIQEKVESKPVEKKPKVPRKTEKPREVVNDV
jgi:hypothetical protein